MRAVIRNDNRKRVVRSVSQFLTPGRGLYSARSTISSGLLRMSMSMVMTRQARYAPRKTQAIGQSARPAEANRITPTMATTTTTCARSLGMLVVMLDPFVAHWQMRSRSLRSPACGQILRPCLGHTLQKTVRLPAEFPFCLVRAEIPVETRHVEDFGGDDGPTSQRRKRTGDKPDRAEGDAEARRLLVQYLGYDRPDLREGQVLAAEDVTLTRPASLARQQNALHGILVVGRAQFVPAAPQNRHRFPRGHAEQSHLGHAGVAGGPRAPIAKTGIDDYHAQTLGRELARNLVRRALGLLVKGDVCPRVHR